jgi:hypothetical protein
VLRTTLLLAALIVLFAATPVSADEGAPFFVSTCAFSHMSNDDPIVWPGRPGYSHDHTFVGNDTTNAFSTAARLRGARTSCSLTGDTAAYWAPTLYVDGRPLPPAMATIYYRRLTIAPVRPFPPGLKMVAGDSHALRPQSHAVTYWDCGLIKTTFYAPMLRRDAGGAAAGPAESSTIPSCPVKTQLQLHVNFPECWDGRHLDSPDHKSHMAYAVAGRCPRSHPVALPGISLVYRYPATVIGTGRTVILASGGQLTGHADFINAWQQRDLAALVRRCLNRYAYCAGP